jgi:hypothetical protein
LKDNYIDRLRLPAGWAGPLGQCKDTEEMLDELKGTEEMLDELKGSPASFSMYS